MVKKCKADETRRERRVPNQAGIERNRCSRSNDSSCNAYKISKPATQVKTANEKIIGNNSKRPVTAKYAPMTERDNPTPNTR